jgi:hypothetical protein
MQRGEKRRARAEKDGGHVYDERRRQDDDEFQSVLLNRDEQRRVGLGFGGVRRVEGVCERGMDGWELGLDFILDDASARWTASTGKGKRGAAARDWAREAVLERLLALGRALDASLWTGAVGEMRSGSGHICN